MRLLAGGAVATGSEVVDKWRHCGKPTIDVPSLLVLVLHFSATHLLLELALEEIDLELQFLLVLLVLGLLLDSELGLLFELFLVFPLQRANLVIFASNDLSHGLLFFMGELGILS